MLLLFSASLFLLTFVQETTTTNSSHAITPTRKNFQGQKNAGNTTLRMVAYYCTTPNNDRGYCLPLQNCSKLFSQSKNEEAEAFLEESKCGSNNKDENNPLVCCGKHGNYKNFVNPWPKSCGHQNVTIRARIIGGQPAIMGEYPWLARLYHKDNRNVKIFGCSGFLITSKFILTAAHCLESENVQYLGPISEVRLGEHDTRTKIDCNSKNTTCAPKLQIVKVKDVFVHHSYDNTSIHHHHDIGLIRLKKPVNFTSFVAPICLLTDGNFTPFEYWLSGWGKTGENADLSHIKMKLSVPAFPHSECKTKYEKLHVKIIKNQLCAGGMKYRDSCTGDSGGPLMVVKDGNHWFASGVVSYGLGCGREGWPGIYTNITSYIGWVKKVVSGNSRVKDKAKSG